MRIISRAPPPTRPQSLAGRDQPDGVAARSGATTLTPGELSWRDPGDGLGGVHLYDFHLRAARYGSRELNAGPQTV
jgi:hypothetical protein